MAFKMNREGFTFYTKPKGPTKHHKMGPTKTMENKGYPKYGHDKGPTKMMEKKGYPKTIAEDEKPDFLDLDGDGNKKEAMKDAAENIKKQTPNVASNLTKTPYEKNKYSSSMPKHGAGHTISDADKKRKEVLIEKLNKMSDPMDSNQGKATLKAIKRIDPNFDAETYM